MHIDIRLDMYLVCELGVLAQLLTPCPATYTYYYHLLTITTTATTHITYYALLLLEQTLANTTIDTLCTTTPLILYTALQLL